MESIAAWELPLLSWGDFWAMPLLRAAAAAGVRVTLGGDGGDELFGARSYLLADRLRAGHPLQAVALARELPGAGDRPARRDVARLVADLAVAGTLPYRMHEARAETVRAPSGAGAGCGRGSREACRLRRPAGVEAHGGSALVGEIAHWLTQRGRGDRRVRGSTPARCLRGPAGAPSRCSTSTSSSSACASRRWRPSTATAAAPCCARP